MASSHAGGSCCVYANNIFARQMHVNARFILQADSSSITQTTRPNIYARVDSAYRAMDIDSKYRCEYKCVGA